MYHAHQPGDGINRMEVRHGWPFHDLIVSVADDCTYVLPVNVFGQPWGAFNGKNAMPVVAFSTSETV